MSPHELREQILALYRQIDENAEGDVDKSLTASRAALDVFQKEPGFAEGNYDLFHDGYRKHYAIYKHCDSAAAGNLLMEWKAFLLRHRPRYR